MMRMGAGALAFAALDAIGYESEEKPLSADRRNSQGLHGSKHRKHRRGSRKHSKGSKENSSAIEALVEQVNNSSSVILEAELQQQSTDDGSSSRNVAQPDSEVNADVIFLVGEEPDVQRIPAHSWILIEKNPVFRAMLTGPLAASVNVPPKSPLGHKRRRTVSGNSVDKNAAYSSLSTIPDNEEAENERQATTTTNEDQEDKPIEFEVKSHTIPALNSIEDEAGSKDSSSNKALIIPTIVVQEDSEVEADNEADCEGNMMSSARSLVMPASTPNLMGGNKTNPIPVSDVDGRTFDIVLRYLYNETVNLQSVMTALTTLYAAHKYMCPGLAKQVVRYLRENLTEKNVLLVLQHICLYCSSAAISSHDETPPITVGPSKRCRSVSIYETDDPAPSAPPLPTISENGEDQQEEKPLLADDLFLDTASHDFEAGMAVSNSSGAGGKGSKKVNCCDALLKQCLELIDREASYVLACEDLEDLDISALNLIVCRDTLRLKNNEVEVFNALKRWSTRECKRQRLELISENRRRVLEGAQYLVRYLIIPKEDYRAGPYPSGLLTSEEAEAVLANIDGAEVDLPDHLLYWQSIWKKPRRGRGADKSSVLSAFGRGSKSSKPRAGSIASINGGNGNGNNLRRDSVLQPGFSSAMPSPEPNNGSSIAGIGMASSVGSNGRNGEFSKSENRYYGGKEKFNFIEEFFICLACIFD